MSPVLLYDGSCGFCVSTVQRVLRHDRRGTLRFAALEGQFAAGVRARHPELRNLDSVVWVEPADHETPERVLVRSDAALAVTGYLGVPWALVLPLRVLPRRLRDGVYTFVARHRHRLPGGKTRCVIPTAETKGRFLD